MQESLTKFKQIFELSPDPVLIIKEGLFVECNDAAVKMMKAKSKEQLLQVLPSEISPLMQPEGKKSFDKAQEMFAEVEKNGVARFNWLHTKFDRSVLDVEVTLARMEINDEILLYVHWKDLTTQKELELALQESKNNLQEVQKMSNIGHWELDLVDGTLYWSDEVYRIFGLQPQEFGATYEAFLQYIHPDDHDLVNKAYADSIQNKSSYHIVHRVLTKQNELKYVEERCIHQYDEDKNVIRSIGTVHDITKRVIYEKELELAANVFKYATDSIVITDADNQIISVNGAYERLTLYSMEDVIGKNPRVLSSGWGDKEFYEMMWNDIIKKGLWTGEIWDRKKDGKLYAAFQSIVGIKDKDEKIINFIGISHDITESKTKEKTIRQLAYYDFLTKLPNRKLFEQEVESYIKASHYNHQTFAILFLDLDNFKWVNDSLGHHFGDKVLIEVSKTISSIISQDSILSRLGGDEFVILVPYKDSLTISQLASKIIESVKNPIFIENREINVGWSIGISLFPENADTYTLLLQNADTAMYDAKAKGKNNFKFFEDGMNTLAKERFDIDTRLRNTIAESGFELHFQPKYSYKEKNVWSGGFNQMA